MSRAGDLQTPISDLGGIGPVRAEQFARLGVRSLADLLDYFPRAYRREGAECAIAQLATGEIQYARGQVVAVDYIPSRPRPRFEATLDDTSGKLCLVWFYGAHLRWRIHPGMVLRVQGTVQRFRGMPQMVNPRWQVIEPDAPAIGEPRLRPVYRASARLGSEVIERTVADHLDAAAMSEWFGPALLRKRGLPARTQAYRDIHRPPDEAHAAAARRRLVYDELMLMQLGLGISKRLRHSAWTAPAMRIDKLLDERIRRRFPFDLTAAQVKAVYQIVRDLRRPKPMNRLLQGDVGSGKTVVALYAMLVAVANKLQCALLAPTEVLAEQHFLTISDWLRGSRVRVDLFTGRTHRQDRARLARELGDGSIQIAVGTQALLGADTAFANLGLVVVDEQHKLGVRQRAVLKGKAVSPHYLVMTATPIPRTLALSYFADFDMTTIDQLPPGRRPVTTQWHRAADAERAYEVLRAQVAQGRQAYVVVPQIDDTGTQEVKSVKREFERLSKGPLRGLRVGMLHGQLATDEKQEVMAAFRDRRLDVLVATTVIEVGIDVPNAAVMLIDNAERFGLSQLHQLRGRVGRGPHASFCLLIGDAPTPAGEARLTAMTTCGDGFAIAEMDLRQRGPGEFFGIRQHGLPEFRLADVTRELDLLAAARQDAGELLAGDPNLRQARNQELRRALVELFGPTLPLAQVG